MNPGIWNWLWWFIFGLVVGGGFTALWFSVKDKVSLKWYEWLISLVTIFLAGFTIQTFFASFAERESLAAWMSLVLLGVPTIVLAVISVRLVSSRIPKA